ncbi:formylmethanofuran dehydrogenase subunit E family protein [Bacteroidota bacterium]
MKEELNFKLKYRSGLFHTANCKLFASHVTRLASRVTIQKLIAITLISTTFTACHNNIQEKEITIEDDTNHSHMKGNNVFSNFPDHQEDFKEDIQPIIQAIIETHGADEFRCGVITSELHGHLGIYAIIGMKMGLYARDILNADLDEIKIISFAGSKPPVSCLNDGLQVSTGATLGHGLIEISDKDYKRPEAIFTKDTNSIQLILKEKYWNTIKQDIKKAIQENNGLTEGYWMDVRKLAIKYWLEWKRDLIFDKEKI